MAIILRFPEFLRVEAEIGGDGWMVLTPSREHGWLFGEFSAAMADANEIASGMGLSRFGRVRVPGETRDEFCTTHRFCIIDGASCGAATR